jgi:hypothetical protein
MGVIREKHLAAIACVAGVVSLGLILSNCARGSGGGGQPETDAGSDAGGEPDAGGTASIPDAGPGDEFFVAFLTPEQEVPPTDAGSSGVAGFAFTTSTGTLSYHIVHNEPNAALGHIHRAQAAVNGDIIHDLGNVASPITGTFVLDGGLAGVDYQDLINARLYVNLHRDGGAVLIRGQILRPGENLYSGQLNDLLLQVTDGGAGGAAFVLSSDGGALSWNVRLTTLDGGDVPNNSHIHRTDTTGVIFGIGGATVDGGMGVNGGSGSRPFGPTEGDVVNQLNGGNTYFNVHTPAMPSGRVQGNLTKK